MSKNDTLTNNISSPFVYIDEMSYLSYKEQYHIEHVEGLQYIRISVHSIVNYEYYFGVEIIYILYYGRTNLKKGDFGSSSVMTQGLNNTWKLEL